MLVSMEHLTRDRLFALFEQTTGTKNQEDLLLSMTQMITDRGGNLSKSDESLITIVLCELIRDVEMSVRRNLAIQLAEKDNAPAALIKDLANDEIDVAVPVLTKCRMLSDGELVNIVRKQSQAHQLAVAMRSALSTEVTEALVSTDNPGVIVQVLKNNGAKFEQETLKRLAENSQNIPSYQEPLLNRLDLPPAIATVMYQWVSQELRTFITERFDLKKSDLDKQIAAAISNTRAPEKLPAAIQPIDLDDEDFELVASDTVSTESAETIFFEELWADEDISTDVLVTTLQSGDIAGFKKLILSQANITDEAWQNILRFPEGRGFIILCRAISIKPTVFAALYYLVRKTFLRHQAIRPSDIQRASDFFLDIFPDKARDWLQQWRRKNVENIAVNALGGFNARRYANPSSNVNRAFDVLIALKNSKSPIAAAALDGLSTSERTNVFARLMDNLRNCEDWTSIPNGFAGAVFMARDNDRWRRQIAEQVRRSASKGVGAWIQPIIAKERWRLDRPARVADTLAQNRAFSSFQ